MSREKNRKDRNINYASKLCSAFYKYLTWSSQQLWEGSFRSFSSGERGSSWFTFLNLFVKCVPEAPPADQGQHGENHSSSAEGKGSFSNPLQCNQKEEKGGPKLREMRGTVKEGHPARQAKTKTTWGSLRMWANSVWNTRIWKEASSRELALLFTGLFWILGEAPCTRCHLLQGLTELEDKVFCGLRCSLRKSHLQMIQEFTLTSWQQWEYLEWP